MIEESERLRTELAEATAKAERLYAQLADAEDEARRYRERSVELERRLATPAEPQEDRSEPPPWARTAWGTFEAWTRAEVPPVEDECVAELWAIHDSIIGAARKRAEIAEAAALHWQRERDEAKGQRDTAEEERDAAIERLGVATFRQARLTAALLRWTKLSPEDVERVATVDVKLGGPTQPAPDRGSEDRSKPPHGEHETLEGAIAACWIHHDSITAPAEARALAAEQARDEELQARREADHRAFSAEEAREQAEARAREAEQQRDDARKSRDQAETRVRERLDLQWQRGVDKGRGDGFEAASAAWRRRWARALGLPDSAGDSYRGLIDATKGARQAQAAAREAGREEGYANATEDAALWCADHVGPDAARSLRRGAHRRPSAPSPKSTEPGLMSRCPSTCSGARCDRMAGHRGRHTDGEAEAHWIIGDDPKGTEPATRRYPPGLGHRLLAPHIGKPPEAEPPAAPLPPLTAKSIATMEAQAAAPTEPALPPGDKVTAPFGHGEVVSDDGITTVVLYPDGTRAAHARTMAGRRAATPQGAGPDIDGGDGEGWCTVCNEGQDGYPCMHSPEDVLAAQRQSEGVGYVVMTREGQSVGFEQRLDADPAVASWVYLEGPPEADVAAPSAPQDNIKRARADGYEVACGRVWRSDPELAAALRSVSVDARDAAMPGPSAPQGGPDAVGSAPVDVATFMESMLDDDLAPDDVEAVQRAHIITPDQRITPTMNTVFVGAMAVCMGRKLASTPPHGEPAGARDDDALLTCAHSCGETPHRFRPSPEAGPHWRCSECGEITPALKVRTMGGMMDQRALIAERFGDGPPHGEPSEVERGLMDAVAQDTARMDSCGAYLDRKIDVTIADDMVFDGEHVREILREARDMLRGAKRHPHGEQPEPARGMGHTLAPLVQQTEAERRKEAAYVPEVCVRVVVEEVDRTHTGGGVRP